MLEKSLDCSVDDNSLNVFVLDPFACDPSKQGSEGMVKCIRNTAVARGSNQGIANEETPAMMIERRILGSELREVGFLQRIKRPMRY